MKKTSCLSFQVSLQAVIQSLILKTPKTKTSVRKVFLPKTVAEMLVERKAAIDELKELFGDEFQDFNLVFCTTNGRPMEGQIIVA